jgi:hypothetical protein
MIKKLIIIVISLFSFWGYWFVSISPLKTSFVFESMESKTVEGNPVYNQIVLESNEKRDIWLMNQSHHGRFLSQDKWERLAIIVNKTTIPKTALFLQLPPGELKWNENLKKKAIENRVSCFLCHSNGPRTIRAEETNDLKLKDRIKVFLWNLRIKTYGVVEEDSLHKKQDLDLAVPFRLRSKIDNEELKIKSCTECHNANTGSGIFNRNVLTRQNIMSIEFMVKNNFMPPIGHTLTSSEKVELENFTKGF